MALDLVQCEEMQSGLLTAEGGAAFRLAAHSVPRGVRRLLWVHHSALVACDVPENGALPFALLPLDSFACAPATQ